MTVKGILQRLIHALARQKTLSFDKIKSTELNKCLGTIDLMAIGVGSTFGSGIYVLTGQVAKNLAGPAVVLSFFVAAIASLLSGFCYTEFATRVPKAGSAYIYTYLTIGEFAAFITGWNLLLEYSIGAAVVARAFSVYLDTFTGGMIANGTKEAIGELKVYGFGTHVDFVSFTLVLLLTILLSTGIKNSSRFNNILTVFNLSIAAIVVITGLFFVKKENWSDFAPFGVNGVLAGASTCFFAFIGFDIIATTAEEAKDPGKSLPLSIIGTICICFVTYFSVSTVVTLMVPYQQLNVDTAVSDAFVQVGARWAKYLVSAGAGISMLCCTLVSMYPLPRMLYSMSQDGLVIKLFSKVHPKTETPVFATVVAGVFTAFMAMLLDLDQLVEMLSVGTLLAYTMVVVCLLKLRYQDQPHHAKVVTFEDSSKDNKEVPKDKTENGRNQSRHIGVVIALIPIIMLCTCALLVFGRNIDSTAFYVLLSIFIAAVSFCGIFLSLQPQNQQQLLFRTPLVPVLPMAALFCNIYLMLTLRTLTWIRLIVWMVIGIAVYFGYSIRHSVAGINERLFEETSPLLTVIHKKAVEKSDKSE